MKNKLMIAIILFAILPSLSLADSATSNNFEAEKKVRAEEVEQKRNMIREEVETRKEAIKNSVEERRQNALDKIEGRVTKFVQNMIERFNAAIGRLEKLAERIESRITKMEANNIDVTEAKKLLATAKTKIETAKNSVALIALPTKTEPATASTTIEIMKGAFEITKKQIEEAKEDIKEAHAALIEVVNNLKPGDNKLKNSAD